jgi:hypothetical protein
MRGIAAREVRGQVAGPLAAGVVADLLGLDVAADTVLAWYAAISDAVSGVSAGREVTVAARSAFDAHTERVHAAIAGRSLLADVVRDGLTGWLGRSPRTDMTCYSGPRNAAAAAAAIAR